MPAPAHAGSATTVDLQFALCDRDTNSLARRLGFEKGPKEVTITYFEEARGALALSGLFLKLKQKKGVFSTEVKVENGSGLARSGELDCEIDRYGEDRAEKCSLEHEADSPIWTRSQKNLAEGKTDLNWKKLESVGSFQELRWKGAWEKDEDLEASLDVMLIPGRAAISELSVKTTLLEEEKTYQKIVKWLGQKGAELCEFQEGKIFRVLGIHKPARKQ